MMQVCVCVNGVYTSCGKNGVDVTACKKSPQFLEIIVCTKQKHETCRWRVIGSGG